MSSLTQLELMPFHLVGNVNFFMHSHLSQQFTVLRKIENEQAEGIIIAPFITTQPWFTRLLRILVSDPVTLPTSKKALYFPYRRKTISEMPDVK